MGRIPLRTVAPQETHSEFPALIEKEPAEYLWIKVRQLYNLRVSSLIPSIRIGTALRYRTSAMNIALAGFTRGAC